MKATFRRFLIHKCTAVGRSVYTAAHALTRFTKQWILFKKQTLRSLDKLQ